MLTVTDLHVSYGSISALRGISFSIPAGAIVTLIGGNGAGKTTTLRTISGLLRAQTGKVEFLGEDITALPAHQIVARGLSHVPEGRMVFSNLTVDENLSMGAYLLSDQTQIAKNRDYVFSVFPRMKERLKQSAGTLSGGEQQMLAIGRAMMAGPRLLLLDEPSLGLAPRLAAEIIGTLATLNQQGLPVLLVEQRAPMALKIARRAYLMAVGRIVAEVTPDEIASPHDLARYYFSHESV
jgi:branched-chain amino acid transport system ATP-binding protein